MSYTPKFPVFKFSMVIYRDFYVNAQHEFSAQLVDNTKRDCWVKMKVGGKR